MEGKIDSERIKKTVKKIEKMNTNENYTTEEYQNAKKTVEERLGFYIHLTCYVLVNSFFVFLNLKNGGYFWAIYPIAGWGIGLVFHGLSVFSFFNNNNWKQRQIHKEIEKQRKSNNWK